MCFELTNIAWLWQGRWGDHEGLCHIQAAHCAHISCSSETLLLQTSCLVCSDLMFRLMPHRSCLVCSYVMFRTKPHTSCLVCSCLKFRLKPHTRCLVCSLSYLTCRLMPHTSCIMCSCLRCGFVPHGRFYSIGDGDIRQFLYRNVPDAFIFMNLGGTASMTW